LQLPGEDRRAFFRDRPHYDVIGLLENRCPRCGMPYRSSQVH
jgi:hypothetical protein